MTLILVISNFNHISKYIYKHKSGLTDIGWHVFNNLHSMFNFLIDQRRSGDMWDNTDYMKPHSLAQYVFN